MPSKNDKKICGHCKHFYKCKNNQKTQYNDLACDEYEERETEEREVIVETSTVIDIGGTLYEEVYDPEIEGKERAMFIALNDNGGTDLIYDVNGNNITYKPYMPKDNNDPITLGMIKLPTNVEKYGDEKQLSQDIQAHIHKWLDISPKYEKMVSWAVMYYWLYDKFDTVPYLRALGDTGTGKTRFLDVIGGLSYKPCFVSGAVTPAPIYRMIPRWKGTIILDEADFSDSSEYGEVTKILNCGFQKNRPVVRCKQNDADTLQYFDAYCPKIIATRRTFKDRALESRCLTEMMRETGRKDIPDILPPEFHEEQESLRNKLLLFRLKNWGKIDPNKALSIDLNGIEPRIRQATRCLASLFVNMPDMMQDFKNFLLNYQEDLIEERSDSFDGVIVNALTSLKEDGLERITSKDIADKMMGDYGLERVTPQSVGKHLKSLGIRSKKKKVEGKTKRCIEWDDELMGTLNRRYVVKIDEGGQVDNDFGGDLPDRGGQVDNGGRLIGGELVFFNNIYKEGLKKEENKAKTAKQLSIPPAPVPPVHLVHPTDKKQVDKLEKVDNMQYKISYTIKTIDQLDEGRGADYNIVIKTIKVNFPNETDAREFLDKLMWGGYVFEPTVGKLKVIN